MAPERTEEDQTEKSFTVSDKRLFTREGEKRPTTSQAETPRESAPPPPRQEAPRAEEPRRRRPEAGAAPQRDFPTADFTTFVVMLANNVMAFLGQIPDPVTQQRRRDLPQAQHMIDILMMLRDKTQGNLTPDEERLLQELLPQLQMAYVAASKQAG
jgi:hypothetical protein